MDKDELTKLAGTIDALGSLFVTVADKDAAITLAETRDILRKLHGDWYGKVAE